MCEHVFNFEMNVNMYRCDFDDAVMFTVTEFAHFGCLVYDHFYTLKTWV